MKAINRLSGDQNGRDAPAVPASGCAGNELSCGVPTRVLPWGALALKGRCRQSGERLGASIEPPAPGVAMGNRRVRGEAGGVPVSIIRARATVAAIASTANARAGHVPIREGAAT